MNEGDKSWLIGAVMWVLLYYGITLGGLMAVMFAFPGVRDFLPVGGLDQLASSALPISGLNADTPESLHSAAELPGRAVALLTSLIGTIVFVVPVAMVYRKTREGGANASMIETLFLLPIVVTTVVVIVKNSLILAFSLFGIVAAVRFRNSLKNPADAVFVFAALAVGLSSGVSEIGIAGVGSMVFCVTVLGLRMYGVLAPRSS
jgi:hypothetical protein